jgi:hypothetical protein
MDERAGVVGGVGRQEGFAMNKFLFAAAFVFGSGCVGSSAQAGTIPYPNPGTVNPAVYNFVAAATSNIVGSFFGFNAGDVDEIQMLVNGVASPAGFGFVNQTSTVGQTFNFGAVNAGDSITFVLRNLSTGTDLSSNPSSNADGLQHVYSTDFAGNGTIPAGTYVAFEDLLASQGSDFDYNDDAFVFTNLAQVTATTPLPGALPLFASGLVLVGALTLRRKRRHQTSA